MKRFLAMLSSRATSPLVFGLFLLLYIGIAFFTDETLIMLMDFIRRSTILVGVLALLPLNCALRIFTETAGFLERRRALAGDGSNVPSRLFEETVIQPASSPSLAMLQDRLKALGYKTRRKDSQLAAWRGFSYLPARLLYLVAIFCLFGGILVSLTTRDSFRGSVVEREPLPVPSGDGGIVERISLGTSTGLVLSKELKIETAESVSGRKKVFGLYPPSRYRGTFVYPRYLGIGLFFRFSAPDLQPYETHSILAIYPPGKEASAEIPDSPYRIVFSLAEPDDGSDPYMTGRFSFLFKLIKGKDVVASGAATGGGEFVRDGYRLSFLDARRVIITDFISDYGVIPIWMSGILFVASFCTWLLFRLFLPRREMLFVLLPNAVHACSRAEGRGRTHGEVFHEALDHLAEGRLRGEA